MYDRNIFKVAKISHKIPTIPSTRASASKPMLLNYITHKVLDLSVMPGFRRNNLIF